MKFFVFLTLFLLSPLLFADQVVSGYGHSCFLESSDNELSCWGWNKYGQLGLGHQMNASGAKLVKMPRGKISDIDAGNGNTCAVVDEKLYCWGANSHGQLGVGDYENRLVPTRVFLSGKVTDVSAGYHHSCAVVDEGVMCWGFNFGCQIGQKKCQGGNGNPNMFWNKPRWVMGLGPGSGVTAVEAGESTSCATKKGGLYCWGSAQLGLLGDSNKEIEYRPRPQVVPGHGEGSGVREISIGHLHSCANRNGMVRCWGVSDFLGVDQGHDVLGPTVPSGVFGNPWPHVSTYNGTTCVTRKGRGYCWGDAAFGALGTGKEEYYGDVPTRVARLRNITALANGAGHTCAISSGKVYCWG